MSGEDDLVYVSIGTGLAAGLVLEGRLRRGDHGAAGEVGHIPVDPHGVALRVRPARLPRDRRVRLGRSRRPGRRPATCRRRRRCSPPPRAVTRRRSSCATSSRPGVASAIRVLALAVDPRTVVLGGGVAQLGEQLRVAVAVALRRPGRELAVPRLARPGRPAPRRADRLPGGRRRRAPCWAMRVPPRAGRRAGQRRRRHRPHRGAAPALGGGGRAAGVRRRGVRRHRDHLRPGGPREPRWRPSPTARPRGWVGAEPLGLHFEGPMILPARKGAHPEHWLRPPSLDLVDGWSREAGVAMATIAPELPGALDVIARLVAEGVVVSVGHTEATAAQVADAVVGRRADGHPPRQRDAAAAGPRARSGRRGARRDRAGRRA